MTPTLIQALYFYRPPALYYYSSNSSHAATNSRGADSQSAASRLLGTLGFQFGCGFAALWGRLSACRPIVNGPQCFSILLGLLAISTLSPAANPAFLPPNLQGIGIEQKLNAPVPLDTVFRDESGAQVPLRAFFGNKPVILAPIYYRCPQLCGVIMHGLVAGLRPLSLKPGRDFNIVAISFNPVETPQDAAEKRAYYSKSYSSRACMAGWHFLVGSQPSIQAVMNAIGFHYRWDPVNKMFIHASGIMVLTPEGRIARYLYGVEFEPKDLKLSLVEASHNRIGSAVDQILLFCYHYDPKTGKYSAMVLRLLHIAAVGMLVLMAVGLFFLWRRDLRRQFKQSRDRGVQGTPASAREGAVIQERSL